MGIFFKFLLLNKKICLPYYYKPFFKPSSGVSDILKYIFPYPPSIFFHSVVHVIRICCWSCVIHVSKYLRLIL